jgi:hypothetical protein
MPSNSIAHEFCEGINFLSGVTNCSNWGEVRVS